MTKDTKIRPLSDLEITAVTAASGPEIPPADDWWDWIRWLDPNKNPNTPPASL